MHKHSMNRYFHKLTNFLKNAKSAIRFRLIHFLSLEQGIMFKTANLIAAEKVEGDYIEFGVYSGGSFIEAFNTLKHAFGPHQKIHGERTKKDEDEMKRIWDKMRFIAFDSFQGLPQLDGIDKEAHDFEKGKYSCSEEIFRKNIKNRGVSLNKVIVVPGLFNDTCTKDTIEKYNIKKVAIVHIDCDLYSSTKIALEFIKPLITDGTIIIFDDWFCFRGNPNLGEQRAFFEWKESMPDWIFSEYQKAGPWTNSFIANKRDVRRPNFITTIK